MIYAVFVLCAYLYVIGCTALLAFAIALASGLLIHRTTQIGLKPFLKKLYIPCLILVCAASLWLCFHPIVTCDDATRSRLSREELHTLSGIGCGFYSRYIPLFPVWVDIKAADQAAIRSQITVFYAYAGTTVYSYGDDGFNCDKPLFSHS